MQLIENIDSSHIAYMLYDRKIVAMFQGRSEAGPRALGNRSMLYTPTDLTGRDYINKMKGREFFRPLAASVLYEQSHEWFDMLGFEEAPYMTFSFMAKDDKKHLIPSVVHVDGSCRIQTVKKSQNEHYYNLISEFYKLSSVPMILNTSFNLAGQPIVETIGEAIETFEKSKIDALYFPELNSVLKK